MSIIKLKTEDRETQLIIHFSTRCMEKGYFLPYSYLRILAALNDYGETMDVTRFCELIVSKKILFSVQTVQNYLATLRNFGIIRRPYKQKRVICDEYLPSKSLFS